MIDSFASIHNVNFMHSPQVNWTTPSTSEFGSMPLGNGETGVNLWTENGRDLCFYLARTDAWDEFGRLCKLARVRVRLPEGVFAADAPFSQRLDTHRATVVIRADGLRIEAWVDAHAQALRLTLDAREPLPFEVAMETWRVDRVITRPLELHCYLNPTPPFEEVRETPDMPLDAGEHAIATCHHNRGSCWASHLELQHLGDWARAHADEDPLLHRTFGALVRGEGLRRVALDRLAGDGRKHWEITAVTACEQTPEPAGLLPVLAAQALQPAAQARPAHEAWWREFWSRSWIHVTGDAAAEEVTRVYALHRYVLACSGRGRFPIRFNGSLFTVTGAWDGDTFTPDFRRWGSGYWLQNTRMVYWPLVSTGDADLLRPLFKMYQDALPLSRERTRRHHNLPGVVMPECFSFWGAWRPGDYGYPEQRAACLAGKPMAGAHHPLAGPDDRHAISGYFRRYFTGVLELLAIGLDLDATAPDAAWRETTLLPLAREYLAFYAAYWTKRDDAGKLLLEPAQCIEQWHSATNPLPDIAGLTWVLDHLLALADGPTADDRRAWGELRAVLPRLPQRSAYWTKERYLIPAERFDLEFNRENPELYAVFPYRLCTIGTPELKLGRDTWLRRLHKHNHGWHPDSIQAALVGLAAEARRLLVERVDMADPKFPVMRFTAFWGTGDWIPDQDHGGVIMLTLQKMILQGERDRLDLLPAWPSDWNVDFRLHAPCGVVEGRFANGKWEHLSAPPGIPVNRHEPQAKA